jgi:hypothetical protein
MTAAAQTIATTTLSQWLGAVPSNDPLKELARLRELLTMGAFPATPDTATLLDKLQMRATVVVGATISKLAEIRLPISPAIRKTVSLLTDTLDLFAAAHLRRARSSQTAMNGRSGADSAWRALWAFSRQLHVACLVSSPPAPGLWQQFHQTFQELRQRYGDTIPDGATCSMPALYLGTLARECAFAPTFTAAEWIFIDRYVDRVQEHIRWLDAPPTEEEKKSGVFWISIDHDTPPIALLRRPPSPTAYVVYFSCTAPIAQVDADVARLRAGDPGLKTAPLPSHLAAGVLRRLRAAWGPPRKRRFPRRRQSYRARICCGLDEICALLGTPESESASEWMVVNESPDGYATMHVAGVPSKVTAGEIAVLRQEGSHQWQPCMVRWALSENPEHLEIGLQLIGPHASAGMMTVVTSPPGDGKQHSVVLLPAIPPLRDKALLITPPGLVRKRPEKLVVVLDSGRVDIRELKIAALVEQSPACDVFSVESTSSGRA